MVWNVGHGKTCADPLKRSQALIHRRISVCSSTLVSCHSKGASGICRDCVEIAKCIVEVICMKDILGFNTKIIDDKGEGDGAM